MLNYTKHQIRDFLFGFFSMAAIEFSVQIAFFLFHDSALYNSIYLPIFATHWFYGEKLVKFSIIGIISFLILIYFKKLEVSKEFNRGFVLSLILYILSEVIGIIIFHNI